MYNFYDGGEGVREDGEDEIEVGGFDQIQEGDVNVYVSRWWSDVRDCASKRNLCFKTSSLALDIFDSSEFTL